jgi:hypothetical protein
MIPPHTDAVELSDALDAIAPRLAVRVELAAGSLLGKCRQGSEKQCGDKDRFVAHGFLLDCRTECAFICEAQRRRPPSRRLGWSADAPRLGWILWLAS